MAPGDEAPDHAQRAVAIVPARLASTRLPRKMLLRETGRYLFEHTVLNARRSPFLERVVLAADDEEVLAAARSVGIEAVATSPAHPSGTDRVAEAHAELRRRGAGPWDVILNVQGDEPELPLEDIAALVAAFRDPAVEIATLSAPLRDEAEALDPSVVKVVSDRAGDALYFSRAPIPALAPGLAPDRAGGSRGPALALARRHVGVYAFRPPALERFCGLPRSALERAESLEQLRWLESGRRMRVVKAERSTVGIDTAEHYALFMARTRDPRTRGTRNP